VSVGETSGGPVVLRRVNADFPHFSSSTEMTFRIGAELGGGTLQLNGKAGPVIRDRGMPGLPMNVLVNAKKVALAKSNLTTGIAPAFDGTLDLDGSVESDGNLLTVAGNGRLAALKLAAAGSATKDPLLIGFAVKHELASRSGAIGRCEIHLGDGAVQIAGRYADFEGRPAVNLTVTAHGAHARPFGSLLAAAGVPLPSGTTLQGGVVFLDHTVEGPLDGPSTSGKITVNNTRLAGLNLDEKLAAVGGLDTLHVSRDLEVSSFTAAIRAAAGRIAVESMALAAPEIGAMSGSGTIGDDATLDFRMEAVRADNRRIPFSVHGVCDSPVFRQPGRTE
jgi:hypothetical protein